VAQGRVAAGQWVAVHGSGGVGLSAVMVAAAAGARVVAVDVQPGALELAARFGAEVIVDARAGPAAAAVVEATGGGAHVSLDALGSQETLTASVEGLRRRGRHVQVGLLPAGTVVPMSRVIGWELEVVGSHGMPAHAYDKMLSLVMTGALRPAELVNGELALPQAPRALAAMDGPVPPGIRVIVP